MEESKNSKKCFFNNSENHPSSNSILQSSQQNIHLAKLSPEQELCSESRIAKLKLNNQIMASQFFTCLIFGNLLVNSAANLTDR
jgi:hypothetical protein